MEELYNYGLNYSDIKHILNIDKRLFVLKNEEVFEKISLLKNINCNDNTIRYVIINNPYYLSNYSVDIYNLIELLKDLNIKDFNYLLNNNPFILNSNIYELKEYIRLGIECGLDIGSLIDSFIM